MKECDAVMRMGGLVGLMMVIAIGLGCRSQESHEHWLKSNSTGFIYGPVPDNKQGLLKIGTEHFQLTPMNKEEQLVVSKLMNIKTTVNVGNMDIVEFITLLNTLQRKIAHQDEVIEIKVEVPSSWNKIVYQCDNGTFAPVIARTFLDKINMSCHTESSLYEILIRLSQEWRPQFRFVIEDSSVCLKIEDFQQAE